MTQLESTVADGDRLYEGGCVLCGGTPSLRLGFDAYGKPWPHSSRANKGHLLCIEHSADEETARKADNEITRRKSLAAKPVQPEPRFYGTMPAELPDTLPAGVKTMMGRVALRESRLIGAHYQGEWQHTDGKRQSRVADTAIDWTTVPLQEAPPPVECDGCKEAASGKRFGFRPGDPKAYCTECGKSHPMPPEPKVSTSAQPAGGGSSNSDPYAAHRRSLLERFGGNDDSFIAAMQNGDDEVKRLYPFGPPRDALDRLVAHRRRLAQATEQLNRKAEPRHPSDWLVEDADELYPTY